MFKRIVSFLLLVAMLCPWLPITEVQAAESADAVAYVDALNGSDDNDGLTEKTAKKTLNGGYSVLKTAMGSKYSDPAAMGKIVLISDYNWVFTASSNQRDIATFADYGHKCEVIYSGKTPDVALTFTISKQSYIGTIGPTTFENMYIGISEDSANPYLSLHGRGWLKIGEGVTSSSNESQQLSISAMPYYKTTVEGYLEINSGIWRNVYAGSYVSNITGNGTLVFNGGTANKVGVVFNATMTGNADITINGGTVNTLCAGSLNTGTVSGTVDVTLCGGTLKSNITTKNAQGYTVTLAPSKGLTLDCSGTLTANTLTGGTLALAAGTQLKISDSVSGTTTVTALGGLCYGNYITAPAATPDSAITFTEPGYAVDSNGTIKIWKCKDTNKIHGLKLQAPSDVTVTLYPGFSGGSAITPLKTATENGITSYSYNNLKGSYRYTATGTGYYSITKNIYISEEESAVLTTIDVTPSKRAGTGWDASKVVLFTDEYMENFPSDPALWPDYQEAFQTPEFTTTSAEHQHTTQKEMTDFIHQLDETCEDMYVYNIGLSAQGQDMPIVVFTKTDLSGAKTLEEVAELLNNNGKLTIHYQGQMHGNEPAGGEGVLAMILKLTGDYGDDVLDTVNIYCIPRVNPDGARSDLRKSPVTDLDMNRDYLLAKNIETQHMLYIDRLFKPTVMIDSHEYTAEPERTAEAWNDLLISPGFTPTSGEDFKNLGITMTQNAFKDAEAQGLSYNFYTSIVNSKSGYVGRNYAANQGTLFFLIESRGIYFGNEIYERRTVGHLITATSFIDYIVENADTVKAVVDAEKQRLTEVGKTYEETDVVILESSESSHPELNIKTIRYNTASGVGTSYTIPITVVDVIDRSRPAPTAYVIPAGESWTQDVLDIMDMHGISYYFVPKGTELQLQGYTGTTEAAELTAETSVTFPNGAYVLTMAQTKAKILGLLMEPDVTDISTGASTLAMAGIIPKTGSTFPIYRYCHDLKADGTINMSTPPAAPTGLTATDITTIGGTGAITGLDATKSYEYRSEGGSYTAVSAGSTTIKNLPAGTYYVRFAASGNVPASAEAKVTVSYAANVEYIVYLSTSGSDSNDGYTSAKAVKTVAKAYSQLDALMVGAPAGTTGKIVLSGLIDLGTAVFNFPTCSYPVVITGKTTSDGFTYKGGGTDKTTSLNFKGDTTLEHMTIKLTSNQNFNYLSANGHKLVLGEGLNCVANSKGSYFNVCGGAYTGTFASTDVTIKSGSWRNIYYGSYTGTVTGDAKLTMTGGMFTNYIQASYNATVNGNCYVNISGVTAGTRITAGPTNANGVKGNATVVLGKNITGTPVIAPCTSGNITGTYTLILDGADISNMTVSGKNITKGTVGCSTLLLQSGTVGAFTDFGSVILETTDSYVKLGAKAAFSPEVKGNSYLDLAGYTLTGNMTGSGTLYLMDSSSDSYTKPTGQLIGTVSCEIADNFKTGVTGSIKRYMDIKTADGYTAHRFYMAITKVTVRPGSTGFGYKAMFCGDDAVKAQLSCFGFRLQLEGSPIVATQTVDVAKLESGKEYTLLLNNYDVARYGDVPVHAEVFLQYKTGEEIVSSSVSYSMKTMLQAVCKTNLSATSLNALKAMCAPYKAIMATWGIDELLS